MHPCSSILRCVLCAWSIGISINHHCWTLLVDHSDIPHIWCIDVDIFHHMLKHNSMGFYVKVLPHLICIGHPLMVLVYLKASTFKVYHPRKLYLPVEVCICFQNVQGDSCTVHIITPLPGHYHFVTLQLLAFETEAGDLCQSLPP